MSKRVLSVLIILTMLISCTSFVFATALQTYTLGTSEIDATDVAVGGTISVPITVTNFPASAIYAGQIDVNFDKDVLSIASVTNGFKGENSDGDPVTVKWWSNALISTANSSGVASFNFLDTDKGESKKYTDTMSGTLFTINFNVLAKTNTIIKLSDAMISDFSTGAQVQYNVANGMLAVSGESNVKLVAGGTTPPLSDACLATSVSLNTSPVVQDTASGVDDKIFEVNVAHDNTSEVTATFEISAGATLSSTDSKAIVTGKTAAINLGDIAAGVTESYGFKVTAENTTSSNLYTLKITKERATVVGTKVVGAASPAAANANDDITYTVTYSDLNGSSAIQFEVEYNKDVVSYKSASVTDANNNDTTGIVKVAVAQATPFTGDTTSVTLTFTAKSLSDDGTAAFTIKNAIYGSDLTDSSATYKVDSLNISNGSSVTVNKSTDELADAKAAAKNELATKLTTLKGSDYYADKLTALETAKTDGDTAIDAATIVGTEAGLEAGSVAKAKADAITAMNNIKNKADYDADKKAEIDNYLTTNSIVESDYSAANWSTLTGIVSTAKSDISAVAATSNSSVVDGIVSTAKTNIDNVKTLADELVDVKASAVSDVTTAFNGYATADYYDAEYNTITGIKNTAITTINSATTAADVATAKNDAISAMAAVKKKPVVALENINNTSSTYTVDMFTDAGVTGAIETNLNKYKLGVKDANKTLTKDEVQAIVDSMNAVTASLGDVSGDNGVNAIDAALVLKYIANPSSLVGVVVDAAFLVNADVNADGSITSADASAILSMAVNG